MSRPREVFRLEDDYLIGRSARYIRRWVRPRLREVGRRARCHLQGHEWSEWSLDDYDGPSVDGMPLFSRDSEDGEYGDRICHRYCGTHERRWPMSDLAQAPDLGYLRARARELGATFE
jgi:hypothetical protein